jgi:putative ABC transport system permease protein
MSSLDRKLLRDLWAVKGQAVAIALVMACAVAMMVAMLSAMVSLQWSQSTYYERHRFANVFCGLKRAPNTLAGRLAEVPGVAQVQTRIVAGVVLDIPKLTEPARGRLISVPDRPSPGLNELYLRKGRYIEPGRGGEVMVGEAFANAHGYGPGDRVSAVLNGRKQELRIVGIVLSPEYIFQIPPGDLFPDDKRFGVFYMGYTELAAAFDMQGGFNDITLTLMPGASEPEVMERIDRLTAAYGGLGAYGRPDQLSHRFVSDEIKQLRANTLIVPPIFLGVAAFLLNMVMSRLVGTQREQIAALKAFGYTHVEVGGHYLKMVLVLVLVGSGVGVAIGAWLGHFMTVMYTKFYHFPVFAFYLDVPVIAIAIVVSAGAAVLGTLGAVRRAVLLPPAEALRPEPPASYRPTVLERLGLQRFFSQPVRMILRQLERRPVKSGMSITAIAFAVSILVTGGFVEDALTYMMEFDFELTNRSDMNVTFIEPAGPEAMSALAHLPGVLHVEPFRGAPVRLRRGHRTRRVGIQGLETQGRLFRLLDDQEQAVPVPAEGIIISAKLADMFHARIGDELIVEVLEGERPTRSVTVAGLVHDFAGISAYMDRRALNRLLREGGSVNGAFLTIDNRYSEQLYSVLKATPRVAGVGVKRAWVKNFWDTMAENLMVMRSFHLAFATIIAFGVVYNNARISLSERSRELATLRVIGFTRAEISGILLGELGVLTLAALPLGMLLGYGFAAFFVWAIETEMFRVPLVVGRTTYAFAVTVVLVATVLSALVVRRQLDHLDLVAVLKSKE